MSLAARAACVLLALAGVAGADPRVDLGRCTAFDTLVLYREISRELPPPVPGLGFVVIVECPDKRTVQLHVEPLPDDGPLARTLDLGEVPGDLQLKLLALAVAELYQVATTAKPPRSPGAIASHGTRPDGVEPTAMTAAPPVVAPVTVATKPPVVAPPVRTAARDVDAPAHASGATAVSVALPAAARSWSVMPTAAVVIFPATPRPLVQIGGELALPWLRLGVRGAVGDTDATLGTIRPWLLTATIARALWCAGEHTSGCVLVRVEGGVAGASAEASSMAAIAHDATAAYGQATLAGEVAHRFGDWSVVGSAEAGWAQGLIARVDGADRVDLAGAVVIGALGVRW